MMNQSSGWVVLIWDDGRLFAVVGPFRQRAKAQLYRAEEDEGDLTYQVVPFFKP